MIINKPKDRRATILGQPFLAPVAAPPPKQRDTKIDAFNGIANLSHLCQRKERDIRQLEDATARGAVEDPDGATEHLIRGFAKDAQDLIDKTANGDGRALVVRAARREGMALLEEAAAARDRGGQRFIATRIKDVTDSLTAQVATNPLRLKGAREMVGDLIAAADLVPEEQDTIARAANVQLTTAAQARQTESAPAARPSFDEQASPVVPVSEVRTEAVEANGIAVANADEVQVEPGVAKPRETPAPEEAQPTGATESDANVAIPDSIPPSPPDEDPDAYEGGPDGEPLSTAEQSDVLDDAELSGLVFSADFLQVVIDGKDDGSIPGRIDSAAWEALKFAFDEPIGLSRETLGALVAQTPEQFVGPLQPFRTFNEVIVGGGLATFDLAARVSMEVTLAAVAGVGQAAQELGASRTDARKLMRDLWVILAFPVVVPGARLSLSAKPNARVQLPFTGRIPGQVTQLDANALSQSFINHARDSGTLGAILRRHPPAEHAAITERLRQAAEKRLSRQLRDNRVSGDPFKALPASHQPKNKIRKAFYKQSEVRFENRGAISSRGQPKGYFDLHPLQALHRTENTPQSLTENIRHGLAAVDVVIFQRLHGGTGAVTRAMHRDDLGSITFFYGKPGKGESFDGGAGLSHIIAKHGIEVVEGVVSALAKGKITFSGTAVSKRATIDHDGIRVILDLFTQRRPGTATRETWVVSGYQSTQTEASRPFNLRKLKGPLFFKGK